MIVLVFVICKKYLVIVTPLIIASSEFEVKVEISGLTTTTVSAYLILLYVSKNALTRSKCTQVLYDLLWVELTLMSKWAIFLSWR